MAQEYTPDFTSLYEGITNTWVLGAEWIIPLALAAIIMLAITRDFSKWKVMFLPLLIAERMIGMYPHYLLFVFAGILFGIEVMSTSLGGQILGAAKRYVGKAPIYEHNREKRIDNLVRNFNIARDKEKKRAKSIAKVTGMAKFGDLEQRKKANELLRGS